eukprot:755704-Hanusia_phi.AAC.1
MVDGRVWVTTLREKTAALGISALRSKVCGLKAAIHIDDKGTIWLNLSQLMKLVGKTKKQTMDLFARLLHDREDDKGDFIETGEEAFDPSKRADVKLLDLKVFKSSNANCTS